MPTAPSSQHGTSTAAKLSAAAIPTESTGQEILPVERVMKADFYNSHAGAQTSALQHMLPLLKQAAQVGPLPTAGILQVVEFGCSGGVNSITPVKLLAETLDKRISDGHSNQQQQQEQLQIMVTHEDLPSNDFASLFQLLSNSQTSYIVQPFTNVLLHYAAIGRSFYEPLFPARTVHLGFSCCALHWLSRAPVLLSSTPFWFSQRVAAEERAAGQHQAVSDLATFLQLRAREYVPGGLLVITLIGSGGDTDVDAHPYLCDKVEACWLQLLSQGIITAAELSALSGAANYHRSMDTTLQSLQQQQQQQQQWQVLHAGVETAQHADWQQYTSSTMTAQQLGEAYANMWRAINEGMQEQLLLPFRGRDGAKEIVGEYYQQLAAAFAADPQCVVFSTNNLLLQRTQH